MNKLLMNNSKILLDYFKLKWSVYMTGILLMIASNVDQATIPRILGDFTDDLQKGNISQSAIVHYSSLLLIVGISYGTLFGIGQFLFARLGRKFEYLIRQRL